MASAQKAERVSHGDGRKSPLDGADVDVSDRVMTWEGSTSTSRKKERGWERGKEGERQREIHCSDSVGFLVPAQLFFCVSFYTIAR